VTLIHILTVALVQGITEFLPISSQAHLILVPQATGWCDQSLVMDIAVHLGTLFAVILYFWRDCLGLAKGAGAVLRGRMESREARLALYVLIATLPAIAAGYAVHKWAGTSLRSLTVIAWTTLLFGVALWVADRWGARALRLAEMSWGRALIIGFAQTLALVPGTSRSGVTMTAARMLGFERDEAARFSLLIAIPVILGAATLAGLELVEAGNVQLTGAAALAAGMALIAALAAIAAMMRWLARASFAPFVIYRVILGIVLLTAVYGFGFGAAAPAGACLQ
jgi:undecaprenyl-diphosphatase